MSFKILFWGTFGSDLGVGLRVLRLPVRFLRVSLSKKTLRDASRPRYGVLGSWCLH